jgi:hypothetical protein
LSISTGLISTAFDLPREARAAQQFADLNAGAAAKRQNVRNTAPVERIEVLVQHAHVGLAAAPRLQPRGDSVERCPVELLGAAVDIDKGHW